MPGPARRYALLAGLRWLPVGLDVPVLVLLLQARGHDLATIGRLLAVHGVVVLLLELPTGGLADVLGRRPVLAASSAFSAAAVLTLALSSSLPGLALAMVLMATGRALGSGPLEAWYVDATRADDPDAQIRSGISAAQAAESIGLGAGAVLGGLLPAIAGRVWPSLPTTGTSALITFSVPFLVSALLFLVHGTAVLVLVREPAHRPHRADGLLANVRTTVRDGVRLSRSSSDVARLLGYAGVLGLVLSAVELLSPGTFAGLLGGPVAGGATYGVLVACGFAASAIGAALATRVAGLGRSPGAVAAGLSIVAGLAVALVAVPVLAPAAVAYLSVYLLIGTNGPLLAEMLHDRVESHLRSTMLSVESLSLQLGGVVASLALGSLAERAGVGWAFAITGAVLAATAFLLAGLRDRPGA